MNPLLKKHLDDYPDCTEATCPHTKNYIVKVIFKEPDNGFIATAQAFDNESAEQIVRDNVEKTHAHLHIKSVEADVMHPGEASMFGLQERGL